MHNLFFDCHVGKKREDTENFINEGVYQVEKLKEEGWITNINYDDEVQNVVSSLFRFEGLRYLTNNKLYIILSQRKEVSGMRKIKHLHLVLVH